MSQSPASSARAVSLHLVASETTSTPPRPLAARIANGEGTALAAAFEAMPLPEQIAFMNEPGVCATFAHHGHIGTIAQWTLTLEPDDLIEFWGNHCHANGVAHSRHLGVIERDLDRLAPEDQVRLLQHPQVWQAYDIGLGLDKLVAKVNAMPPAHRREILAVRQTCEFLESRGQESTGERIVPLSDSKRAHQNIHSSQFMCCTPNT